MSGGFTKLYGSIVLSTVWREPHPTRIVSITMLALADARGYVGASVPGLADAARVTREECDAALASFLGPDPDSRSKDNDGRRIEVVNGGWLLLNYETYRNGRDPEVRRQQNRDAQARYRATHKPSKPDVSQHQPTSAQAEAEAEAEANQHPSGVVAAPPPATPPPKARRKGKSNAAKWRRVPSEWQPNDNHRRIAAEEHRDFDKELAKFRDHEYPRPKTDADAAFRSWLRSEYGRIAARAGRNTTTPQRGVADESKAQSWGQAGAQELLGGVT